MSELSIPLKLKFSISDFFVKYYYIFVMIFYYFSMLFTTIRPGVLASIVMCIIIITNYKSITFRRNSFHFILVLYLFYNIFTGLYYINKNMPFSVFYTEFSNSILPAIFFFIGKHNKEESNQDSFYKIFAISVFICLIIGLFYYIIPNQMYLDYMKKITANFTIENYLEDRRLNSFIGSTEVGSLSAILVVIAMSYIVRNGLSFRNLLLYTIALGCSGLSMQRSSIIASVLMIIFWHIYGISLNKINHKFIIAEIAFIFLFVIQILRLDYNLPDLLITKLNSLGTAISERSNTWINAVKYSPNIFFGGGLGSVGHKALAYAKHFVHDGNYFKILAETGIIGLSLFVILLLLTFFKALSNNKRTFLEISIVSILLFQAIGSNVLSFQTLLPVFWYSIGRIWSYKTNFENNSYSLT
jgi:hypothetical protein